MTLALEQLSAENARLHGAPAALERAEGRVAELEASLKVARYWLGVIDRSASWRITRPLRSAMRVSRRISRRTDPSALNVPM
jgi:hypothetical protein